MTVLLSDITFDYDFFSIPLPDGSLLILNQIDESLQVENKDIKINGINIVVSPYDGTGNVLCSSVIGTGNDYFTLTTDYEEYKGKVLTTDNLKYCYLEMKENG